MPTEEESVQRDLFSDAGGAVAPQMIVQVGRALRRVEADVPEFDLTAARTTNACNLSRCVALWVDRQVSGMHGTGGRADNSAQRRCMEARGRIRGTVSVFVRETLFGCADSLSVRNSVRVCFGFFLCEIVPMWSETFVGAFRGAFFVCVVTSGCT